MLCVLGSVTVNGGSATSSNAGGGSGGTISIETNELQGSGIISANGGTGHGSGGGGSGGRIAVRWKMRTWSFLDFQAIGGQGTKKGGAGTMYFEVNEWLKFRISYALHIYCLKQFATQQDALS